MRQNFPEFPLPTSDFDEEDECLEKNFKRLTKEQLKEVKIIKEVMKHFDKVYLYEEHLSNYIHRLAEDLDQVDAFIDDAIRMEEATIIVSSFEKHGYITIIEPTNRYSVWTVRVCFGNRQHKTLSENDLIIRKEMGGYV